MRNIDGPNTLKADEVEYQGWEKAFRLCNDTVQLIITTEVGPRIMSFTRTPSMPGNAEAQTFAFMAATGCGFRRK